MTEFQIRLKKLMNEYAHFVYDVTKDFPKEETYSTVSQWRRATLSIVLNYIEGYARKKYLVRLNFYDTSYGSLSESIYLLEFVKQRNYINQTQHDKGAVLSEEIGKMLWTEISSLEKKINK